MCWTGKPSYARMANIIKKFKKKVFHRRKLGVEDRSRPHSSLDVPSVSESTVSLNDNISKSVIHQSQVTLVNPRTASPLSSAPSRVDTDRQRSEECSTSLRPALVKAGSVAWKGLETALRLLEKSSGAFPPLKSAVGILVACLDLTEVNDFDLIDVIFEVDLRQSSKTVKSMKT